MVGCRHDRISNHRPDIDDRECRMLSPNTGMHHMADYRAYIIGTDGQFYKAIAIDCDRDTLLLQVEVEGAGLVCHEGTRSCFTKPLFPAGPDKEFDAQAVRS